MVGCEGYDICAWKHKTEFLFVTCSAHAHKERGVFFSKNEKIIIIFSGSSIIRVSTIITWAGTQHMKTTCSSLIAALDIIFFINAHWVIVVNQC